MNKIGIITYHAAYNYGSVLQAFATLQAIKKMGIPAEIINYRMKEQKNFYQLYRMKYGIRTLLKDLMQIPVHFKRIERQKKFEKFLKDYMQLTNEFENPCNIVKYFEKYDIIVSGSDQIWNKHSCELENCDWKYMEPYLLSGFKDKKVSYASSIANMEDHELEIILPYIKKFHNISIREKTSLSRIEDKLGKDVKWVLDPTFLLTKREWINILNLKKEKDSKYILYYSLGGLKPLKRNKKVLKEFAKKNNCKVRIVTPFVYTLTFDREFEICSNYGPIDFLNSVYNAEAVITDSYHGTILSINFGKDIYSLCENRGSEFRKTDILKEIGLDNRIIFDINDILSEDIESIDYSKVHIELNRMRNQSLKYLRDALVNE